MRPHCKQKEFFEKHASVWDEISVSEPEKIRYIMDIINPDPDSAILDIGTGTGVMIPYYLEILGEGSVTAVDFSPNMIAQAKKKFPEQDKPELRYVISDLYDYEDIERFDLVVCYSCFPHFRDKNLAVGHLLKSLKKGGVFVIAHSCSRERINEVHESGGKEIEEDRLPDMKTMTGMFERNSLNVIRTEDNKDYFIIMGIKS